MKKLTEHQQRILNRLEANRNARIKHEPVLKSYDLIDGAYRESLKPITFRVLEVYLEVAEEKGLSHYYRLSPGADFSQKKNHGSHKNNYGKYD